MDEKYPKVLNKRLNQNDGVYIGRPSRWGNPFEIGKDGTRIQVLQLYEEYLFSRPDLIARAKQELKGKNLICWCAPLACHGDLLLKVANEDTPRS